MVKPLRRSHASPASCGEIPVTAIDKREDAATAAIRDFEKQRAVAFVSVFRTDGMKSEENSTSPSFRLTALLRSTMRWLCGLARGGRSRCVQ